MTRPAIDPPEAWLDKHDCAALRKVNVTAWWGLAKRSRILRAGRIETPGRTFWLRSAVTEYLRSQEAIDDAGDLCASRRAARVTP